METDAIQLATATSSSLVERKAHCPCCGSQLPSRLERRFTILDAMILVVASALAFTLLRSFVFRTLPGLSNGQGLLAVVMGGLVTWTPTLLWLRLRRPRPTLRRLARQPGFAASIAGTAVLALGTVTIGLLALIRLSMQGPTQSAGVAPRPPDPTWWLGVVLHFGPVVGPAVIAAWFVLAVSGRRRPARGWLDPLGRTIGVAWIILFVINCCARLAYLKD